MVKIERTVIINAPVEKVFDYMTDPTNLPEIWPCLVEVNDLYQTREGTGTTYNWVYKMAGTHFEGKAEITELIPNQRLVIKDEGGIKAIRTISLQPLEKGTKYTLQMDYVVPSLLLGELDPGFIQRLNECEADVVLANLKVRMEAETLKV